MLPITFIGKKACSWVAKPVALVLFVTMPVPPEPPGRRAPAPADLQGGERVTLRAIGERLGVSHVAVSLALRDRPGISEELRSRIKALAAELGYRPDPALTALSKYRRGLVGQSIRAGLAWLTYWRDPEALHRYHEADAYWRGAEEVAERHGYKLYRFAPDARNSLAAVERVLRARNIEGILIPPPEPRLSRPIAPMDWRNYSVVRYGHSLGDALPFHMVTSAQAVNTLRAVRRLREMGYRRVGFVSSLYSNRNMQFLYGYLRARDEFPEKEQLPYLALAESNEAEDAAALRAWLRRTKPDVVFSNLSTIRRQLEAVGCIIPGKLGLAVTSVQDCDCDSGIDQSPFEIGKIGCELLISLLLHGHRGFPEYPRELLVEGRWCAGSALVDRSK